MSAFRAVAGRHRPPASSSLHSPDTASRPIGQYFAARPDKRNLSDQFLDEQIAKRVEVFCDQDKSTRPANHVVSIVLFQSTWRIRVLAIQCESFVGENDQAIDCNASRNCLVSSQAYITAVIVIAVSGHIDRTPSGVKRCACELGHSKIDPAADGRTISERTGDFQQLIAELLGGPRIIDYCPIDHEAL